MGGAREEEICMKLFDAYCSFGELALKPPSYSKNAQELIAVMDRCGIEDAVVFHSAMRYASAVEGNEHVIRETAGLARLRPSWAVMPHHTGEQPKVEQFIDEMSSSGVNVLYAFPDEHGYILDEVVFGGLFEEMVRRRIPLFLKPKWNLVYSLLKQYPQLILVAVGHGPHGDDRYFRPMLERYKNFYMDTSCYLQEGGIEEVCRRYGAHRLLFSTGYPNNCIGGPILRLLAAGISPEEKERIAHENIESLLEQVRV